MIKLGDYFVPKRGTVTKISELSESSSHDGVRLITATEFANGGSFFFIPRDSDTVYNSGLTINNNGNVGKVFFHDYKFAPTSDVTVLIPSDKHTITRYEGLYLKTAIEKQKDQFMYGYKISNDRLKNIQAQIPLTKNGQIDWNFMENTIKPLFNNIDHTLHTKNNYSQIISLNNRKWHSFKVSDVLIVENGVRLTKENMIEGNIPFIGASSKNNGITNWISNENKSIDQNVLGVNYNGSVVDNFYHPYKALFSDDVKRIHIKDPNVTPTPYKYLFLKAVFLQHKAQYQYGYKFDSARMKNQRIMLPVDDKGDPDWNFMENYIKSLPFADLI